MTVYNRPSVNVLVSAAPPARDNRLAPSRFHAVGLTHKAEATPTVVRGMGEFDTVYGPRQNYSPMWDAASVYFAEGGSELVVGRVVGPGAVSSSVDVDDQQGAPETSVTVTAVSPGVWGDDIDVTFANGSGTGQTTMTVEYLDTVVEVYTDKTPAELADATLSSRYVRVTEGNSTASGDQLRPAVGEVSLTSGDDDRDNITDTEWADALATLDESYGIGQVAAPGETTGARHTQLADHAETFNRVALLDVSPIVGTATSAAVAVRSAASDATYAAAFVGGLRARVDGQVRSVPSSPVAAGLMARNDRSRSVNDPAAGVNGICVSVVDGATYTASERNTLTTSGVNAFKAFDGRIRLYGYRSVDLAAWALLSNVRLRMAIKHEAEQIAERFLFAPLDGQGRTIAAFAGDLSGMLAVHYEAGALFGDTAAEAYVVDVSGNTSATAALGELHARIGVRFSAFAEVVIVDIVKVAVDEAIAA